MSDYPILFSTPMVQALLNGRKTQTRRLAFKNGKPTTWYKLWHIWQELLAKNPGITPGDRLWVRETVECKSVIRLVPDAPKAEVELGLFYSAGPERQSVVHEWPFKRPYGKMPSIHMPRKVSRITLIVTGVKRERLQDISEEDATAEGVEAMDGLLDEIKLCAHAKRMGIPATECRVWFAELWESINGEGSWESNPEVIAIAFEVVKQNIDTLSAGVV